MKFNRLSTAVVAVAGALALTACGGGDDATTAGPASDISSEFNDADVRFVRDMIPHHEGALDMAELAADRAESDDVKDLASRIEGAQDPEIDRMKAMLAAWDQESDGMDGMEGMEGMGGGMDMGAMTDELEPLEGAAFDRRFLELMTEHHSTAITMAETELSEGENPQAKELAQEIIDAQKAEIEEMKGLLAAA